MRRIVLFASVAGSILCLGWLEGYRINLTPSEPLGLWQVVELGRPPAIGDLIFICPPATQIMREAKARGYLRRGSCPGGVAPLIKTVIAVEGQRVEVGASVLVDGEPIASSDLSVRDGRGRSLAPFAGGIVPQGQIFLHASFQGSFDSRYFGPVPASGTLGLARKVLTYAP